MSIWSCATQNHVSENFAWGWARQFYHVDAVRTYLWKETHSGMNVIPVSCKWRLSYLVWNQSTSTFSKSLKLELIYLVINKSGQLPNLFVCVIFLIRSEVSFVVWITINQSNPLNSNFMVKKSIPSILIRKPKESPRRGIEPRSPAWQAGILTTILPRNWMRLM